jgi:hypothetical protein
VIERESDEETWIGEQTAHKHPAKFRLHFGPLHTVVLWAGLPDQGHLREMDIPPSADDEDSGTNFGTYNHMVCPFRTIYKDEVPISKTCRNSKSELRHMKFVLSPPHICIQEVLEHG